MRRLRPWLLSLALASTASAGILSGKLSYPSEELPAMLVVARAEDGTLRSLTTRPGQDRYVLEVPDGTYQVYAFPMGTGGSPLPGAHTAYSLCARDRTRLVAGKCGTGPLVGRKVAGSQSIRDADIDDWYISEALASTLSRPEQAGAMPAEPTARTAPSDEWRETGTDPEMNFSAWPAEAGGPAKPAPLDVAHLPAAAAPFRAQIERGYQDGPVFAREVAVARWGCGTGCESWALIDGRTGRVTFPGPPFDPVQHDFSCDAEPLEYRLGSRQLRVHRREGDRVRTQYFLWSTKHGLGKSVEAVTPLGEWCKRWPKL